MTKLAHLKEIENLKKWAVAASAEAEALTNPYELMRLRVAGGVAIVWRKQTGKLTWNDLALKLRAAFQEDKGFPADLRLESKVSHKAAKNLLPGRHRTIIERDGFGCFYCGEEKTGQMTIEHLVPRAHGGPRHLSNEFRADTKCNAEAGHLSAPEKILMREARHIKFKQQVAA